MNIGHFAADETAHQHVGRFADGARAQEDVLPLGMRPPATANQLPSDGLSQTRNGPAPRFESDAVGLHKGKSLLWGHLEPRTSLLSKLKFRSGGLWQTSLCRKPI